MEIEIIKRQIEGIAADCEAVEKALWNHNLQLEGPVESVSNFMNALAGLKGRAELCKKAIERMEENDCGRNARID